MTTFFIKTFGCRVNQVESQALLEDFLRHHFTPAADFETADICVLNTCTVTHQADKDVEKLIRQILRRNPNTKLILTGCYAAAHRAHIREIFPTARIVGKYDLGRVLFDEEDLCWTVSGHEGHSRAFIKIQDGCDCFCSYCIVPFARTEKRSKPLADVLTEIKNLVQNGFAEIVLTGINIGNFCCPKTGADLAALCEEITKLPGNFRVRFSSIELQTVTDGIIRAMQNYPARFCNYLHLPLQAGSDPVLQAMNRHYNTAQYAARVADLRKNVPGIGIFADVIAGFPTETKDNFEETVAFIRAQKLAGLHVFSYSPRPGTKAAKLPQLPAEEIKRRAEILRALDKELRGQFAASFVGTEQTVFVEEYKEGQTRGLTSNFQTVFIENAPKDLHGLAHVKITHADANSCYGKVVPFTV
ncbi:tRNA (N(6)-L-threonylcarbamoyladenosine(37)-C(2))-methylthiotransferase MtaB [Candidatus Avelusimicrobium luingense]|uniref:tRNA (N(6)-L-threonylcarbamoyladenosine(37)-C(2))- methylthiotransferase MtaB n=1 Tax=Candidatus Avelusimicrobium luingense TaxID=3416211 RepID=UPI003D0F628F